MDGRVSEEVVVSIPTISPVNNGLNWSQNPSFKSSECDLDIRTTADMFNMHASEGLQLVQISPSSFTLRNLQIIVVILPKVDQIN